MMAVPPPPAESPHTMLSRVDRDGLIDPSAS
jgi:hypothetical protein